MKVEVVKLTPWSLCRNLALFTEGKDGGDKEPTSEWKRKMLDCEHSPIRSQLYLVKMYDIPYWVSVHFVRHKFGVEHFVSTQREDRTGKPRNDKPQNAPVNHAMLINASELIFMARRRLCHKASEETREVFSKIVDAIRAIGEMELANAMVPECVYRGRCPEMKPCERTQIK